MKELTPTDEQLRCLEAVQSSQHTKINAFSGAGKSSTLRLIANTIAVPSLYLCFNKANADEARDRFPAYVKCATSHSMAFAAEGYKYTHKLNRPKGAYKNVALTPSEIAKYFKLETIELDEEASISITAPMQGWWIRQTVSSFEQSADTEILYHHQPAYKLRRYAELMEMKGIDIGLFRRKLLQKAQQLWSLRINPKSEVGCSHDTYLKLWQLSSPDLSQYSIIYLDESQDSADVLLDILSKQTQSKLVLVGDSYQSIYMWRGAVNAMTKDMGLEWAQEQLTQSFRFGDNIARLASLIINTACVSPDIISPSVRIRGTQKPDSVVVSWHHNSLPKQHTRIYRTNAALLMDAVMMLEQGKKIRIDVDVKDMVGLIESCVALFEKDMDNVKHTEVVPYSCFQTLKDEAEATLLRVSKMVEDNSYYRVLGVLKNHRNPPDPDIIFTTAHKSKGLEWDCVYLADDFPSIYGKDGELVGLTEEERNLLYVAATRARQKVFVNSTVIELISLTSTLPLDKRVVKVGGLAVIENLDFC